MIEERYPDNFRELQANYIKFDADLVQF